MLSKILRFSLIPCLTIGLVLQTTLANHPVITEFVAVGNDSLPDEDGDTPDWLEITNPTNTTIAMEGYHLTDDPENLTKWTFPAESLPPSARPVIFASNKDRATSGSELHTNFRLSSSGEYLALVAPDGTTIVSEFAPTFPEQLAEFSYGIEGSDPNGPRGYFSPPTPGLANGTINPVPLLSPVISPASATFTGSQQVTLALAGPAGQIRYTTNGSQPTSSSPLYNTPLTLSTSTHLRARVFDPQSGEGSLTTAAHFQRLSTSSNFAGINAPQSFTSDLPIMVVENFGEGTVPGPGQVLQTARAALFNVDPATGRSSLSNPPDASFRIGIRRRGQSSSGFAKPQYRVELRAEDDSDLNFPLLGLPSESDWVFNGPWTDKSLVRNAFSFELARTLGNQAPNTRHFEMFLSTNGGSLTSSEYVGVYALFEKIKLSKNRTDLEELDTTDNSTPDITGGYIMRFEPPGIAVQGIRASGWSSVEIIEPKSPTTSQRNYVGQYFDDFVATLGWSRGSGSNDNGIINPDPVTGYPAYIDVDSFVNHFIITELGRDQDGYVRSDYMYKDRNEKLHKGPVWDHNLIMGTGCCFDNRNPIGWQYQDPYNRGVRDHNSEPDWFVPLMRDPDFRQKVTDRWSELRLGGPFQLDNLFTRLDAKAEPLTEAAVRNFTRWDRLNENGPGFPSPATDTWEEQIDFMKTWLTTRTTWIDEQFLMLPLFSEADGSILNANEEITVQSDQTIYYTTDGSDPRLSGGNISANAIALPSSLGSVDRTIFARESTWSFLDDGSDQGLSNIVVGHPSYGPSNWKHPNFDASTWSSGSGVFGFGAIGSPEITLATEIKRRPDAGGTQFISYYFRKTFQIDDASDVFSLNASVLRDDGVIIYLNGQEVARSKIPEETVLGSNDLSGGSSAVGEDESTYHDLPLDASLLVDGTNVITVALYQQSARSSDVGFDLELTAQVAPGDAPTVTLPETTLLRARSRDSSGEWSALSETLYIVGIPADPSNLIISEINYNPAAPTPAQLATDPSLNNDDFEWIELRNMSNDSIDLSRVTFTDGISAEIAPGVILAPGAYALLVANPVAFELRYGTGLPVIGSYENRLSNDGETIQLNDRIGAPIALFTFNDIWYPESDGDGFSLILRDQNTSSPDYNAPLSWNAGQNLGGTPGAPDSSLNADFIAWQNSQFSVTQLSDPEISGPLADPDSDSLTNLLEYAMGLDPLIQNQESLPAQNMVTDNDELFQALTFQRKKNLTGEIWSVETSPDLISWESSSTPFGSVIDNQDGTETLTLRAASPSSPETRLQFIRLKISFQ